MTTPMSGNLDPRQGSSHLAWCEGWSNNLLRSQVSIWTKGSGCRYWWATVRAHHEHLQVAKQQDNKELGLNIFILTVPGEKLTCRHWFCTITTNKQATPYLNNFSIFGGGQKIGQQLASPGSITCDHKQVTKEIKQHFLVRTQNLIFKLVGVEASEK